MIEPGRAGAYIALFSEIGLILLVTTLIGVLAGHWVDEQLGTLPVFLLVGFLLGAGTGTAMIYRLVSRFLRRSVERLTGSAEEYERGEQPRSRMWRERVERAARDHGRGRRRSGCRTRTQTRPPPLLALDRADRSG